MHQWKCVRFFGSELWHVYDFAERCEGWQRRLSIFSVRSFLHPIPNQFWGRHGTDVHWICFPILVVEAPDFWPLVPIRIYPHLVSLTYNLRSIQLNFVERDKLLPLGDELCPGITFFVFRILKAGKVWQAVKGGRKNKPAYVEDKNKKKEILIQTIAFAIFVVCLVGDGNSIVWSGMSIATKNQSHSRRTARTPLANSFGEDAS